MRNFSAAVLAAAVTAFSCAAQEEETCEFDRMYAGAAGTMVFPQGGAKMHRRSGAALRAGFYLSEFWAVEAEAAWLEDRAGLAAKALWHWWGYERLDPFFTVGARGWLGGGQAGPAGGAGAFYHLTESLSLRVDADATLGLDSGAVMVYSLSAGLQMSF